LVDVGIYRSRRDEIDDADCFAFLTVAVNTAYPLFHTHGIPRQIIIHEVVAELEVESFASNFGRKKDVDGIRIVFGKREALAKGGALFIMDVAMNNSETKARCLGMLR
jgi:hypothetical protein